MRYDRFWEIFLVIAAVLISAVGGYFFLRVQSSSSQNIALGATVVGVDPFERDIVDISSSSPFFYRESLPARFDDWSWNTSVNWRSTENLYKGVRSIKATYKEEWAGARASGPVIGVSAFNSISLAVNPSSDVGELYIELYDAHERAVGQQSLGWYAPEGKLVPNTWQEIAIPLSNIFNPALVRQISGFSISTQKPGVAYIDEVRLSKEVVTHAPWNEEFDYKNEPVDLFKDAIPHPLPYTMFFLPEEIKQWKSLFGRFEPGEHDVKIGPLPEKNNGSIAMFTGGKAWVNYRVDAVVYWGPTSSFSLLTRFSDDGNFISCAFSEYGAVVQIYQMKAGVSTLVGQSPGLPIPAEEAWKDVKHGAEVEGDTVRCLMDGQVVLKAQLPTMPTSGTVGIETWTRNSFDKPHILKAFVVEPL